MSQIALAATLLFALLIGGAGILALTRPVRARALIGRFATSWRVNACEQLYRGLVGAALVVRAPDARTPLMFETAGWVILASAIALLVVPLRWHAQYAQWWSQNLPLWLARVAGGAALVIAVALGWSAWG